MKRWRQSILCSLMTHVLYMEIYVTRVKRTMEGISFNYCISVVSDWNRIEIIDPANLKCNLY